MEKMRHERNFAKTYKLKKKKKMKKRLSWSENGMTNEEKKDS